MRVVCSEIQNVPSRAVRPNHHSAHAALVEVPAGGTKGCNRAWERGLYNVGNVYAKRKIMTCVRLCTMLRRLSVFSALRRLLPDRAGLAPHARCAPTGAELRAPGRARRRSTKTGMSLSGEHCAHTR